MLTFSVQYLLLTVKQSNFINSNIILILFWFLITTMSSQLVLKGSQKKAKIFCNTLGDFFFEYGDKFSEKTCQIDANINQSETFKSVKSRSTRLAIYLQKIGLRSKDIIVSCSANNLDNCIPIISASYIGAIIANLDPTLSRRQATYLLKLIEPKIVFVDITSLELIEQSIEELGFEPKIIIIGSYSSKYANLVTITAKEENEKPFQVVKANSSDIAIMFFSSGTTGFPKAICHTHKSFLNMIEISSDLKLNTNRIFHFTTFYWISGMLILGSTYYKGGCRIYCQDTNENHILSVLEKYKVTGMFVAPFYTYSLINASNLSTTDLSSLKMILTGGTPINPQHLKCLQAIFPYVHILFGYGLSETGFVTAFDPILDQELYKTRLSSCGKLVPGCTVKFVDVESGNSLGPHQNGELYIKNDTLLSGYYKNDETPFDEKGYLKSGDIGYYDEDGCVYIVGRTKEMFKYLSWHIIPSAIEAVIEEHPSVQETIVFGVPLENEEEGEVPAACVILKDNFKFVTTEEIKLFVNNKVSNKEQLRGGVYFVEDLPRTPTGKPIRQKMRSFLLNA